MRIEGREPRVADLTDRPCDRLPLALFARGNPILMRRVVSGANLLGRAHDAPVERPGTSFRREVAPVVVHVRLQPVGRDTFHARSALQQAEKTLQSQPMLRISRSCLVSTNQVREISRTPRGDFILVLAGGATVTSSEGFREAARPRFDRFRIRAG